MSDVVIQHSHLQDVLPHSSPLGLAHCLLYVEPLPFGCVSSDDCELMQLETLDTCALKLQNFVLCRHKK